MNGMNFLSAQNGTFVLTGTSEKTVDFVGFYVMEDCVLADLEDSADADVRTTYLTAAGDTIKAGVVIRANSTHGYFSAITLTSGSVVLILK